MSRKGLILTTLVASSILTSCHDSRLNPTEPGSAAPSLSAAPTPTLDQDINGLIDQLFPLKYRAFVHATWNGIKLQVARNPNGKPTSEIKLALNSLVAFMKTNETQLLNVLGETRQHALVRLVLEMLMYVYNGPATPPPPVAPATDIGLGTVQPTATTTTTITTPAKHAAVEFPGGSVNEQTTVIIEQNNTPYPQNCSGPMNTRRCQYPQFYKVNVFPDVKLNKPAKVAVCHVNSGANRLPLRGGEFHDRFRLAHDRPANPADYMPGAIQEDGIEILPLVHVEPTVMDCTQGDTYSVAFMRTHPGALGNLVDRARWLAGRLAFAATHALTPKSVYAIDQGGGGELMLFSNVGDVDPQSAPDLKSASFTVQETELFAGETAHVTALAATNAGTGSAGATTTSIRLSPDSTITTADVELASQPTPALVPNATAAGAPVAVVIPPGTAPGTYYLGMLADAGDVAAEENETNNFVSVRITVKHLVSATAITCPASVVYSGAAQTPCTVTVTGAGLSLTPPATYTNNTAVGTATATYEYQGDATYGPSAASKTFLITRSPTTTAISCTSPVVYSGEPRTPCSATVTGRGLELPATPTYENNTSAGTATASYTYAGDANYEVSSATRNFQIDPAPTTTTLTCPTSATYTGSPQTCTATTTGPGAPGSPTITYSDNTNAGPVTATATYAPTANYLTSTDTKTFSIAPAATTTTVTCPSTVEYTGSPQSPCSMTTTGAGLMSSGVPVHSNNTNAGTATATGTFAATTNYLTSTDTKQFTIVPAATQTTLTCPASASYTGNPHLCTAVTTGPGTPGSPAITYTDNVNAGSATAIATFAATPNYLTSTDTKNFSIARAATTTTVDCPASVSYTGSAQTPCSAATTGPGLTTAPPIVYANNINPGPATATASYSAGGNYLGSSDVKTFTITVPAGPLTVSPAVVEKLPGGTQTFTVTSGGPGPYVWSVNGVAGGNGTYGTITSGGAYIAPAAVPTPSTFDVCAQMQGPPQNSGCASVTIKPIPSTGGEVIVFNDENMFDNSFGTPYANNPQFYRNLVQFSAPGSRATQTGVLMHRGHGSICGATECSPASQSGFYNVLTTAGFTITDVNSSSATITAIPASIKVIFLWMPVTPYSNGEINILKQFASEGGRLIFVGEHVGYYGTNGINTENAFFASMGAQMTNQGGAYDCGHVDLPATSLRSHQITSGLSGLAIACASRVIPGPNDYPLFYDHTNTIVLAAVAKVDLTPLTALAAPAQVLFNRSLAPGAPDPLGGQYTGWSATPIPAPKPPPAP